MSNRLIFACICLLLLQSASAQYDAQKWIRDIDSVHKNTSLTDVQKMQQVQSLAAFFVKQKWQQDSVYALLLHRIGLYLSRQQRFTEAIDFTSRAMQINTSGRKNCSPSSVINHLNNIAWCYKCLFNYTTALQYYQQAMAEAGKFPWKVKDILLTHRYTAGIQQDEGNYQEAIRYAMLGLSKTTTDYPDFKAGFCNIIADAAVAIGNYRLAKEYLLPAMKYYRENGYPEALLACQQTMAQVLLAEGQKQKALQLLEQIEAAYADTDDREYQAVGFTGLGIFFKDVLKDWSKAATLFRKTIGLYPDSLRSEYNSVSACNNLGQVYAFQHRYADALQWFQKAFTAQCRQFARNNLLQNPSLQQIKTLPNDNLSFITLHNKAELLLQVYLSNRNVGYLQASKQSFLLADSILSFMKLSQTEQDSKLFWRKKSRNFYQQALQMCYVARDNQLAFYFMEKSRAVLLNDYVNETAASKYLSNDDRIQEQNLRSTILEKQLQLADMKTGEPAYTAQQTSLLEKRVQLEMITRRLEAKYPAYAQNRETEDITPLGKLQQYLLANRQQWVQYFLSDTLLFVLYANGRQTQLQRHVVRNMETMLPVFAGLCADKEKQLQHFDNFIQLSHCIYDTLLGDLPLQPGRLIISPDNVLIPFDALCSAAKPHRWMVEDYAISYAHAARFLLKMDTINQSAPDGSFLGMAPVCFPNNMHLATLGRSEKALEQLDQFYPSGTLLVRSDASSKSFFDKLPHYTVANLYTHARGNVGDSVEPQLFFADTAICLSELQKIRNAATRLVVLTACQTNAGRLASGEGVFSMARGFAMAGIPSVVATLWTADETATYWVTNKFHEYLTLGLTKDLALQKAKLDYMKLGRQNELPYLWANVTLTGSADSIRLAPAKTSYVAVTISSFIVLLIAAGIVYRRFRSSKKYQTT